MAPDFDTPAQAERSEIPRLATERLVLRAWRPGDRAPFATMNADPTVMAHFPAPLDRAASDVFVDRIEAGFAEHGFGLWALEVVDGSDFIGFVGLSMPGFEAAFTPCVEIGWRLAASAWGQGYATEAAIAVRDHAFDHVGLDEIVSFTTVGNVASRRVMQRIAMRHDPAHDFDHPSLEPGHRLRRHVLYRLDRTRWREVADRG